MNGIDESLSSIFPGPQSPCERTDLRMAIVADHLGLSWTGEKYTALLLFSPNSLLLGFLYLGKSVSNHVIYCHLQANNFLNTCVCVPSQSWLGR